MINIQSLFRSHVTGVQHKEKEEENEEVPKRHHSGCSVWLYRGISQPQAVIHQLHLQSVAYGRSLQEQSSHHGRH